MNVQVYFSRLGKITPHTHTHTHIYTYIHIYIYKYIYIYIIYTDIIQESVKTDQPTDRHSQVKLQLSRIFILLMTKLQEYQFLFNFMSEQVGQSFISLKIRQVLRMSSLEKM